MILQFTVRNFKLFKDSTSLSFIATNYDKKTREDDNVIYNSKYNIRILKSAVVYGANASGKSKLLDAFCNMKEFVVNGINKTRNGENIYYKPFLLDDESENISSEFELVFIHEDTMYRYGFEIDKTKVISEWLYFKPKTKEVQIFFREGDKFETHERIFKKGKFVVDQKLVGKNTLLLSVGTKFNDELSIKINNFFESIETPKSNDYRFVRNTSNRIKDNSFKKVILEFLKAADIGIVELNPKNAQNSLFANILSDTNGNIIDSVQESPQEYAVLDITSTHKKFDLEKNLIGKTDLSFFVDESSGTIKFYALAMQIIDAFENGSTLIIDELDSEIHPNLVNSIISLFNSKEINKNNAQLLFTTHNTNLLSSELFRRDQIWFTEKNKYGEAKLFSLSDFKSEHVKKKEPFEENYKKGKYGAVPYLGNFDEIKIHLNYENEKQNN